MAWQDWNDPGTESVWNEFLDVAEDEVKRFAGSEGENLDFSVTGGRWDEPDVELRWTDEELQRNIHVVAKGKTWPLEIEYSAGVWQDLSGLERAWNSKVVDTRSAHSIDSLPAVLQAGLDEAFLVASSLSPSGASRDSSLGAGAD